MLNRPQPGRLLNQLRRFYSRKSHSFYGLKAGTMARVMKRLLFSFLFGTITPLVATMAAGQAAANSSFPSDADIRKLLVDRIDNQHQSVGIVIGLISPEGQRVISYGQLEKGRNDPLNGDTVYEIGSISKVFTSLLLADMVQHKQVSLDDPVAKFLPANVKVPERNGKSITLVDLSTHTSGLPRLPSNLHPKDPGNPYADYTVDQLYEFLSGYQLTRDIGAQYQYSNLGGGLLGHALARRAGKDYEALVRSTICDPLGMKSTAITLTPDMKARLAVGHDIAMKSTENWDLPTLAGAGALRSTTNDMLKFLAANMGYTKSPLSASMNSMLQTRRPTDMHDVEIALGWHISTLHQRQIVWHNGGTGGYRTFIGFDPQKKIGVVAFSNAGTPAGVDDIGRHLLDPDSPLIAPAKEHKQVAIDPKLLDGYVGTYQLAQTFLMKVTRDGDHLYMQATGQPQIEIFPESDHDFFVRVVDAQITFVTGNDGHVDELILHQGGRDQHAKRTQ